MATQVFRRKLSRLAVVGTLALALSGGLGMGLQQAGAICTPGVDCDPPPGASCTSARNKLNALRETSATAQQISDAKFLVWLECEF